MNMKEKYTVTIDGEEYDILDALCIGSRYATHAQINGGLVVECKFEGGDDIPGFKVGASKIDFRDMAKLGIQPLLFKPKVPEEFVETFEFVDGIWRQSLGDLNPERPTKRFRCVEVMDGKILDRDVWKSRTERFLVEMPTDGTDETTA